MESYAGGGVRGVTANHRKVERRRAAQQRSAHYVAHRPAKGMRGRRSPGPKERHVGGARTRRTDPQAKTAAKISLRKASRLPQGQSGPGRIVLARPVRRSRLCVLKTTKR